jgi:predicted RNA-binding Zn-ribbon protein involved in translation (DUF1610 family)
MAKCPKCGKVINYLINVESGWASYRFDGENYEYEDFEADGSVNLFECPECGEVIAESQDEASEFLKGEKNG